jgi:hypothetical protein
MSYAVPEGGGSILFRNISIRAKRCVGHSLSTAMSPLDSFVITVNPSSQWIDRVTTSVLQRATLEGSILHTVKGRKVNWIGQSLRRNRLLKHFIEGTLQGRI